MPRHQPPPFQLVRARPQLLLAAVVLAAGSGLAAQTSSGVLTGFVTDGAGSPAPRTTVAASGDGGTVQETRTDDDGRFRLSLPPGPYRLDDRHPQRRQPEDRHGGPPGRRNRADRHRRAARDGVMGPEAIRRQSQGVAFVLAPPPLAALPLDRADPSAAILALAPGVARGTAFGAAADIGTPRRLDGLDLGDPLDGSAWTSFVLPSATGAAVRAGVGADERDGSGAVLDIVTRAGGASLRGIVDVVGGGSGWSRETLSDETLSANPRLAVRDRPGRSVRAATVLSGPLTPHLGFGLAAEYARRDAHRRAGRRHQDAAGARPRRLGVERTHRATSSASSIGASTTKDVPFALRADAGAGPREPAHVEHHRLAGVVAEPAGRRDAAVGVDRGAARHAHRRGRRATCRAARTTSPARITGSLGLVEEGGRTRTIAAGALDWRTARMGGHDVRVGGDIERTQVSERAAFSGGEFFHDIAGRPDTVDVWLGSDRDTHLGREAVFVTDTWTPARRLAISAGLRAAHLSGGAYGTTSVQPRVGATLAVDDGARLVARASAGVVADPLYATHVDRTVGGETAVSPTRSSPTDAASKSRARPRHSPASRAASATRRRASSRQAPTSG